MGSADVRMIVRAVVAGVTLTVLVLGSPVALYLVAGSPLPDRIPDIGELTDALTSRDDGTLLIGLVEFIAWGAWLAFVAAVLMEIGSRLRGSQVTPRLPALGGMQQLAAMLIASVTLAVASPAVAASGPVPTPPVAVTTPLNPLAQSAPMELDIDLAGVVQSDDSPVYRVKHGDTLSKIARDRLGSPRRWSTLWRLNARSVQPDGQVFDDPHSIRPGWKLRLPAPKPPKTAPTPASLHESSELLDHGDPTPVPEIPRPSLEVPPAKVDPQVTVTVELPSGSLVAMAFAAGISTACVAGRFQRRRRHVPPPASEGTSIVPEPQPASPVQQLRRAHVRSFPDPSKVPSDAELLRAAHSIDVPHSIVIGRYANDTPAALDLAGLSLGLDGQGAHDVIRYLVLDVLRQASNFRAEIVICTSLLQELFGISPDEAETLAHAVPGLAIAATRNHALDRFEEEHFTRLRMMVEREAGAIDELRERDPGEALPAVLLVSALDDDAYARVGAILASNWQSGMGAILLGDWPTGTTCSVDAVDHRVNSAAGTGANELLHAELCHLTTDEAAACLRELASAHLIEAEAAPGVERTSLPGGQQQIWNGPELVRLSILGPPMVQVCGKPETLQLTGLQLQLLVFLALHPEGATRDQLSTALWPDETGKDVHNTLRHVRDALVTATGFNDRIRKKAPFIAASTTGADAVYRIDPNLISTDVAEYRTVLDQAKAARSESARIAALSRAAELSRGELVQGLHYEWLEEHRYPLTRSQADSLSQLAELYEDKDLEAALGTLERARTLDPDNENTYIRIIEIQLRLAHREQALRTAELMHQRLRSMGIEVTPSTEKRLASLLRTDVTTFPPESIAKARS
jgi:DNA-binding SARP family transcriptional activator